MQILRWSRYGGYIRVVMVIVKTPRRLGYVGYDSYHGHWGYLLKWRCFFVHQKKTLLCYCAPACLMTG